MTILFSDHGCGCFVLFYRDVHVVAFVIDFVCISVNMDLWLIDNIHFCFCFVGHVNNLFLFLTDMVLCGPIATTNEQPDIKKVKLNKKKPWGSWRDHEKRTRIGIDHIQINAIIINHFTIQTHRHHIRKPRASQPSKYHQIYNLKFVSYTVGNCWGMLTWLLWSTSLGQGQNQNYTASSKLETNSHMI